ncbi:hypothetical protein PYW07_014948 [Mythimna separata]|uniref:EGF-like domain-containing protein n=1 Tax=Mythimna separata TaxID=271217 RepID=A0AAD7Z283_MYTSE|nr:hypothetical protein PYW07_014948 [Mythimna separata]
MVKTCCIKTCKSESYSGCGVSFHRFPSKEEMKQKCHPSELAPVSSKVWGVYSVLYVLFIVEVAKIFRLTACWVVVAACALAPGARAAGPLGPSDRPEAYFNGSSYIRLSRPISLKQLVGLSFRTCVGGELFSQRFDGYTLHVTSLFEQVVVSWQRPSQPHREVGLAKETLDNRWHWVGLRYNSDPPSLLLEVDKDTQIISNVTWNPELLSPGKLEDPNAVLLVGNVFSGCILEGPQLEFHAASSQTRSVVFGHCPLTTDDCIDRKDVLRIQPKDHCYNEPCMRHGTCISRHDRYECHCTARYTGNNCEVDAGDPCASNPCQNAARCVEDVRGDYSCDCPPNYHGTYTLLARYVHTLRGGRGRPVRVEPVPERGALRRGRARRLLVRLPAQLPRYVHTTSTHGTYTHCEVDAGDPCASNPCQNAARCVEDVRGDYSCDCPPNYHGTYTLLARYVHTLRGGRGRPVRVEPVPERGALRRGRARRLLVRLPAQLPRYVHTTSTVRTHTARWTRATRARRTRARTRRAASRTCAATTRATARPTTTVRTHYKHGTYTHCEVDAGDPCASNPCQNAARCVEDVRGDYSCDCPPNYHGTYTLLARYVHTLRGGRGRPVRVEPVPERGALRRGRARRLLVRLPAQLPRYVHTTSTHGTYTHCEVDAGDPCASNPCQNAARCVEDVRGDYSCDCPPNYHGTYTLLARYVHTLRGGRGRPVRVEPHGTYTHCEVDAGDPCASNPCQNAARCVEDVCGDYSCDCPPNYHGMYCELEVSLDPLCVAGPCRNNGSCSVPPGADSYVCACPPGYTGRNCETDVDECAAQAAPCLNGGSCQDAVNNFTCDCTGTGYTGARCELNVNECEEERNICGHGVCYDTYGSYVCACQLGYKGERCNNVSACASGPCGAGGACVEESGGAGFRCVCARGFAPPYCEPAPTTHPASCQDIICPPKSHCISNMMITGVIAKQVMCVCDAGYYGAAGVSPNCTALEAVCEAGVCLNGATCSLAADHFNCTCAPGYKGTYCEQAAGKALSDLKAAERCASGPCLHAKSCQELPTGFRCECEAGWSGQRCDVAVAGAAGASGCGARGCANGGVCLAGGECECRAGWAGAACELPADCRAAPCPALHDCAELAGAYSCVPVAPDSACASEPCHNGTCQLKNGLYSCLCPPGITGQYIHIFTLLSILLQTWFCHVMRIVRRKYDKKIKKKRHDRVTPPKLRQKVQEYAEIKNI